MLSDAALYEYTNETPPESLGALRLRYTNLESRRSPDGTQAWLNWVLVEKATGISIGYIQATVDSKSADVAWVVGTAWQGRGFATEAARSLLVWLRRAGVRTARANINKMHIASQRVAANIGFSRTDQMIDGEDVWIRRL